MNWTLYGAILLLQLVVTYPHFARTCASDTAVILYFLHHGLDVYVFWGPFVLSTPTEFAIHLLVIFGIAIHWITNNYECILTTTMNEQCGYPRKQWLDSLVDRLRPTDWTHIVWILVAAIYDVLQILRYGAR